MHQMIKKQKKKTALKEKIKQQKLAKKSPTKK